MKLARWIDAAIAEFAPRVAARRAMARVALEQLDSVRAYEAGMHSRRTENWRAVDSGPNTPIVGLDTLRARSRDLVENNGWCSRAVDVLQTRTVGCGIIAKADPARPRAAKISKERWKAWFESTDCDVSGEQNGYGLQSLAARAMFKDGESLIVRRWLNDPELAVPMQLQVLECDHIDTWKTEALDNGGVIVQGVEYDALGRRVAYWLYPEHPRENLLMRHGTSYWTDSVRFPARDVIHLARQERARQARGIPWGACVMLVSKDFDDVESAEGLRSKIAACFTAFVYDQSGMGDPSLGVKVATGDGGVLNDLGKLFPGAIKKLPAGTDVKLVAPPISNSYEPLARITLRRIAMGYGVTYEELTGDLAEASFSATRVGGIIGGEMYQRTQWLILVPRLCVPLWRWFQQGLVAAGAASKPIHAEWTPPVVPVQDPEKIARADAEQVKAGFKSQSQCVRERGYDPDDVRREREADFAAAQTSGVPTSVFESTPGAESTVRTGGSPVGSVGRGNEREPSAA